MRQDGEAAAGRFPSIPYTYSTRHILPHVYTNLLHSRPSPMLTMPLFTKHYRLTLVARLDPPSGVDPRFHSSIDTLGGLIAYADSSWRNPVKLGYKCFGHVVYMHGGPIIYAAEKL